MLQLNAVNEIHFHFKALTERSSRYEENFVSRDFLTFRFFFYDQLTRQIFLHNTNYFLFWRHSRV